MIEIRTKEGITTRDIINIKHFFDNLNSIDYKLELSQKDNIIIIRLVWLIMSWTLCYVIVFGYIAWTEEAYWFHDFVTFKVLILLLLIDLICAVNSLKNKK